MAKRNLPPWSQRAPEVARLLNPAFLALVLHRAVDAFGKRADAGMPLGLAYLVPPLALHAPTRRMLPTTARTRLHTWLAEKGTVRIGFAGRASALVPYTREALLFGTIHNALIVTPTGALHAARLKGSYETPGGDARECMNAATLLGKLFAAAGDANTIFAAWGVYP